MLQKLISCCLCSGMESKESIKTFLSPRNRIKVLPWQHLLPSIVEKLISSNPCRGLECKELRERLLSPRNMKKCCLVARCCLKTNLLQSAQGYGKQRTHKNIYKSKKQKKVLSWQLPLYYCQNIIKNCPNLKLNVS